MTGTDGIIVETTSILYLFLPVDRNHNTPQWWNLQIKKKLKLLVVSEFQTDQCPKKTVNKRN